jgi:hypothetical protein
VVIGEAHTASDVVPVELDRTNIDISTIRVRTVGGLLFQPGDDYTIAQQGGRVFLTTFVVGGAIPPNFTEGQNFLVDYEFFVDPDGGRHIADFTIRDAQNRSRCTGCGCKADITSTTAAVIADSGPHGRHRLHVQACSWSST